MKCPIPDCKDEIYHTVYICNSKHQVYDLIKEFLVAQSSSDVFRLLAEDRKKKLEKMKKKIKEIEDCVDGYDNVFATDLPLLIRDILEEKP